MSISLNRWRRSFTARTPACGFGGSLPCSQPVGCLYAIHRSRTLRPIRRSVEQIGEPVVKLPVAGAQNHPSVDHRRYEMGTVFHRWLGDSAALHRFNSYIRFERTRLVSRLGLVLVCRWHSAMVVLVGKISRGRGSKSTRPA